MMADIHPEPGIEAPEAESPKPVIRESAAVKPHEAKWHQRLAAALIFMLGRTLAATVRFRLEDRSGYFSDVPQEKLIFAIWHNRLSLALILYRLYVARRDCNRRLVALVSASRDGSMMARVLELFEVQPVRGSSSRRGAQAMLEMVSWAERGHDLAITPDGPRGPRYVVQEGVISTARLTGLPIVPVSYRLSWKIQLKSWDRFQIPLPFTRCEVVIAPAIRVPREATDEEREILRQKLETELRAVTRD